MVIPSTINLGLKVLSITSIICWSAAVLALTLICIRVDHQRYPIITINTHDLKSSFENQYGPTRAIHDIYNVHMQNFCYGNYQGNKTDAPVKFVCTERTSHASFTPADQIAFELNQISPHGNGSITVPFFHDAQLLFQKKFNHLIYVSLVFYVLGAVLVGTNLLLIYWRVVSSMEAAVCLLMSSAIITAVQDQAVAALNSLGNELGVYAVAGRGVSILTWTAFALAAIHYVWEVVVMKFIATAVRRNYQHKYAKAQAANVKLANVQTANDQTINDQTANDQIVDAETSNAHTATVRPANDETADAESSNVQPLNAQDESLETVMIQT